MTCDLSTKLAHLEFSNPLMNASGVLCANEAELNALQNSASGALITKSATPEFRAGNPEPRYVDLPLGSINSMGLPNLGLDFYLEFVLNQQKQGKSHFLSVAGMCLEDNLQMLKTINNSAFNGITELNLSCPNLPGKPQIGYDFAQTLHVLRQVFAFFTKPLGVKLPPYFDMAHFDEMAEILNQFPLTYVNCINSIGNALFVDFEREQVVIKPKDGFGGLGGAFVKPTALANVRAFYQRLNKIALIGTGGINSGQDAFEHILCGAQMVQIGTCLQQEGVQVFERILRELQAIMTAKNYTKLDDFRGKLKTL